MVNSIEKDKNKIKKTKKSTFFTIFGCKMICLAIQMPFFYVCPGQSFEEIA